MLLLVHLLRWSTWMERHNNGFLYVGSLSKVYYDAAVMSGESIKDYWPEANLTLFTHKRWVDDRAIRVFQNVVTDVPVHCRAKLWALDQTPYNKTVYMDADTYCESEKIQDIFEELPDDYDMVMTENRPYNAKVVYFTNEKELRHWQSPDKEMIWEGGDDKGKPRYAVHKWDPTANNGVYRMRWHCGMFIYNNKPHTLKMLNMWYQNYRIQIENKKGWEKLFNYPRSLWFWDTFAFWRTNFEVNYEVKIKEIHPKWNFVRGYRDWEKDQDGSVMFHYTIPNDIIDKEILDDPNIRNTIGDFDVLK